MYVVSIYPFLVHLLFIPRAFPEPQHPINVCFSIVVDRKCLLSGRWQRRKCPSDFLASCKCSLACRLELVLRAGHACTSHPSSSSCLPARARVLKIWSPIATQVVSLHSPRSSDSCLCIAATCPRKQVPFGFLSATADGSCRWPPSSDRLLLFLLNCLVREAPHFLSCTEAHSDSWKVSRESGHRGHKGTQWCLRERNRNCQLSPVTKQLVIFSVLNSKDLPPPSQISLR